MFQLIQIKLTSQTTNHVESTEILSTSQHESRIIWLLLPKLIFEEETGY